MTNPYCLLGKHFICEFSGCDRATLLDNDLLEAALDQAAEESNLSVLGRGRFDFDPAGFSGYLLLAESHASLHVWPEHGYCAVDLFTCNLEVDTDPFFEALRRSLGAEQMVIQRIDRGYTPREGSATEP